MTTRVLIADDHALVRDGLRHILTNASGFEVAGEASDGAGTLALVRSVAAHVLVLDLSMPGRNGIELIKTDQGRKARAAHPRAHHARRAAIRGARLQGGRVRLPDEGKRERRTGRRGHARWRRAACT